MEIIRLAIAPEDLIRQAADLLSAAFPWDEVWCTPAGALDEVYEGLRGGVIYAAVEDEQVVGWIGGLPAYHGKVWELHPLVVREDRRGKGIGRALVEHLEGAARAAGVATMMIGADDEEGRTTLSQFDDLYAVLPGILGVVTSLDPAKPHPVDFYKRLGYSVVGVLPDANGSRKPDIYLAKRLSGG